MKLVKLIDEEKNTFVKHKIELDAVKSILRKLDIIGKKLNEILTAEKWDLSHTRLRVSLDG